MGEEPEVDNDWVVTVMHQDDVEQAFGPVVDLVKEQGLELDYVQTADLETTRSYAWAEVHFYGTVSDGDLLRGEFRRLADDIAVDLVLQKTSGRIRDVRLVCFDMDSTLIQGEVIDELAKMAGVADRVVAITAAAMRGEIEFQESFRRRVGLLEGLPMARAGELLERIPLMDGAERLFAALRAKGVKTAILSGGFTFFGAYLKDELGVDYVFANELDVDAAGYVTGEVTGRIVDGARKAELLGEIAAREGVSLEQVVAVGDGANDLPMLRLAGMGVAFHAKAVVRAEACFALSHVGLDGLLGLIWNPADIK